MAMTTCPNCGEQISDKAKKCVHCGAVLIPEEKKYCPDCGAELEEEMESCPKCGCPIENDATLETTPQQVEVTGVKVSKKSKKLIVIGIIAVIAVAISAAVGVQVHKKNVAAKAAAEAQKQKQSEEYGSNLSLAAYSMLSGASDAETCGNLIKQVWYNAIYKESDSKTDKYTKPDGYYVSDFNDALQNLFSDSSFSSQLADINDNKDTVSSLMKKLKNPPEDYKDAYDSLLKLYDAYISLTNLATDPTGSLQTYSQNFNDADSETLNCYNALKMYLEE